MSSFLHEIVNGAGQNMHDMLFTPAKQKPEVVFALNSQPMFSRGGTGAYKPQLTLPENNLS